MQSNQRIKSTLNNIGLSNLAGDIYCILIQKGAFSITEIAKQSGKYRPMIYKAVSELLSRGIVTSFKYGKRTLYKAESPLILSSIAQKQLSQLSEIIPELLSTYQNQTIKPKISFFDGKDGIKTVFERLIQTTRKGEALYRIESPRDYKRNKKYYPPIYWKRAGASGDIDKYVITNQETHSTRHKNLNRFSRALHIPFENNITQIIGNNIVAFIDYDTESAILIENDRFTDFQKTIFKNLFEKMPDLRTDSIESK